MLHLVENKPDVDDVTKLSPLVVSVLGQNPGQFTLTGTNTYLVGTGSSRILIDTGEGADAYLPLLKATLDEAEASIQVWGTAVQFFCLSGRKKLTIEHISGAWQQILITHHHYDHVGGIQGIRSEFGADITGWSTKAVVASGDLLLHCGRVASSH